MPVHVTVTELPETLAATPETAGAVCTTFSVEAAVAPTLAPCASRATARTWCDPSLRPLVITAPSASQLWPSVNAASWPMTYQFVACSAWTWTVEGIEVAWPEAVITTLEPADPVDWVLPRVSVPAGAAGEEPPPAPTTNAAGCALDCASGTTAADTTSDSEPRPAPEKARMR